MARAPAAFSSVRPASSSSAGPAPALLGERTLFAALFEPSGAKYASWEVSAIDSIRATPFGTWEAAVDDATPKTQGVGLSPLLPCESKAPPHPPEPRAKDRVRVLSEPSACVTLALPGRPAEPSQLQWYGWESGDRSLAVLRPAASGRPRWLLVLSETLISPAGPWLAPAVGDLDGDGVDDLAFVAQGVDGCDRGPCPLNWIEVLVSGTNTLWREEELTLLRTDDIERKLGLALGNMSSPSWQARIQSGIYQVTALAGRRQLAWSASIAGNRLRLGQPEARSESQSEQAGPGSRRN
jgi:hypothetical protein